MGRTGEHALGTDRHPRDDRDGADKRVVRQDAARDGERPPCPVVGVGASAGGLEPLKRLFRAADPRGGVAYVVVQHLDPSQPSHMVELLARHTGLAVVVAEDDQPVEADHIYLNPPAGLISLAGGRLRRDAARDPTARRPIDHLFTSLADGLGEWAVCILLSGTGTDGTQGLRAIHDAGGLAVAQAPSTAEYSAMPQSAVDTGLVSFALPPDELPAALLEYVRQLHQQATTGPGGGEAGLQAVLDLLMARGAGDFRAYKDGTVRRRIERRMGLRQVADVAAYLELLRDEPGEVELLAKDMLIGVTSFFREPESFEVLREHVLAPLANRAPSNVPLRIWVPGCATGEEAYTIAMLLLEELRQRQRHDAVQIFASDLSADAVGTARAGRYPESIANDVPPALLQRYFSRQDGHYQVEKPLREALVFAQQDLISDPPFSRLDLVSCRNLLIYLKPETQRRILGLFGFALKPGGHLLLGKSESLGEQAALFQEVSRRWRLYRSHDTTQARAPELPGNPVRGPTFSPAQRPPVGPAPGTARLVQDVLLAHFDAAMVIVDKQGAIRHFFGPTARYLSHPTGEASLDLRRMLHPELAGRLRPALQRAGQQHEPLVLPELRYGPAEAPRWVDVTIRPLHEHPGAEGLLAVVLVETRPAAEAAAGPEPSSRADEEQSRLGRLERELAATQEDLRITVAALEAANEAHEAAHEEVSSMNEELQSSNEELQSSKEELQSMNEELNTTNSQLLERVAEVTESRDVLSNLFAAVDVATIFLDAELCIRRFTPHTPRLLNVIEADIGRPIGHITANFPEHDLQTAARAVIESQRPEEREVVTTDGRWYTARIHPYCTADGRIDGVVIAFTDVTRLAEAERVLRAERDNVTRVNRQLQALNQELDGFTRAVAHDLQAPVRRLQSFCQALREELGDQLPGDSETYLERIFASSGHVSELIKDLLRLSQCSREDLDLRGLSLSALARAVVAGLRQAEPDRQVSCAIQDDLQVRGDERLIRVALENLLGNAWKFTRKETEGRIELGVEEHEGERRFFVRDNGVGFDPAYGDKLFGLFKRLHGAQEFEGTGIGLVTVRRIIRRHGGRVWAEGAPGEGATFYFTVP